MPGTPFLSRTMRAMDGSTFSRNLFPWLPIWGCWLLWPRWRKHSGEKSYPIASARNPTAQTVQMPRAGLVLDASRNFYGTTPYGDGSSSCGTVFKLTPVWRCLRAAKHGGHGV